MTGCTVIVRRGGHYILGKVRHSGYNVAPIFEEWGIKVFDIEPLELWKRVMQKRQSKMSSISLACELDTLYPLGFPFIAEKGMGFRESLETAYGQLDAIFAPSIDGLQCSYSDYGFFVDYDNHLVTDVYGGAILVDGRYNTDHDSLWESLWAY